MASIILSKIPTDITRWEELHLFTGMALVRMCGNLTIREAEPNQYSSGVVYAATAPLFNAWDSTLRIAPRLSLEMDPLVYTDTTKKFWKHVRDISTQPSPAGFLLP